jgi:two-component system alkaline phosphatase synthesis response regulator PhoP
VFVAAWVDPKGGSDMFRVLICDDDAGIRTFLRAVLEDGGVAVEETADGDECVEAVRRRPPDLLILDFMMPKRDGISALAEIGPEFPDLPVLMVSAYLEDVRDVAEVLGARCFVKSDFLEHAADLLAEFTGIEPVARTELV